MGGVEHGTNLFPDQLPRPARGLEPPFNPSKTRADPACTDCDSGAADLARPRYAGHGPQVPPHTGYGPILPAPWAGKNTKK